MGTMGPTTEKGRSMSQDESRFKMGPPMGKRFYGRKPRRKRPHQVHYHHHLDGPPFKHRGRGRPPPPRYRHRPHNDYHSAPPKHKGWKGWKDEHDDSHEDDDHHHHPPPKKEKHRKRPWFFPGKGSDSDEKDHQPRPHPPKHDDHSPEAYYYKESKGYEGYKYKGSHKGKGKDDKAKKSFKFHKIFDYDHGWDAEKGGSSYKGKEADDDKIQIPKIIINHHHNLPPTGTPGFIPGAFPGPVVGYHPPLHYHERYHATGFPGGLKRDYKSMEMVDPYVVHNHIPPPHPRPMPGFVPNFVGHAASQPVIAASPLGSNSVMNHFAHNMPNHFMQGKPPMPHMDDVSFGPPNHPNHFPNPNGGMGDHFPKPNPPPGQDPSEFGAPNHFPQGMNPQIQGGGFEGGFNNNNNNNFHNPNIIPANMIENFEVSQNFPQEMHNNFGGNGNENGNNPFSNPSDGQEMQNQFGGNGNENGNNPFSNPSDGQEIQNGFGADEDNFPQPNPPNNPNENFEMMSNGQGAPDSASFPSTDDPSNSNEFNIPFTPVPAKGETPPPTRGPSPATSFFQQNSPGPNQDLPTRSFEFDMIKTLSQGFEIPSQKSGGRNGNFSFPLQSPRHSTSFFDMGVPDREQYKMKQNQQKRNKPSHYSKPMNQNSNERPMNRFKPFPNIKVESDELNNYSTLPGSIRNYRPDPSHAKLPRLTYDAFESGSKMQKMRSALHPKSLMKAIFNRFPRGRNMDKKGGRKGGGNSNFNDDNDQSFLNMNSAHTKFTPYDAVAKSKDDMNSQRKRRKSNKIPMSIQDIIDSDSTKKEVVSLPEGDTNNGDYNIDDYGIQQEIEEQQRRSPLLKRMGEIIIGTPINANKTAVSAERRSISSNELQTETPFENDADVDELGIKSISIPLEAQIQMQGRDYEVAQEEVVAEPKKKVVKKKKKKRLNISLNSASLISSSAAASRTRHLPQKTSNVERK
ncbi:unnamed protein product [Orchesella dallaii]|uniref:Uncharacterized protein n=1 Tax=Orchesella dallaii TaxID=48710 RepID=A0ABP1QWL4_9HEXA